MSKVSVVLPTYNRATTISRAINSVLHQTYSNYEIIVVDDNSSDDTTSIISQFGEKVRYFRHETNRGAAAARNTGIKKSDGELIAFIDSDDEWKPEKLDRQVREFKDSRSDVGVIYSGFHIDDGETCQLGRIPSKRGDIFEAQLAKDWVNPTSTVMVRRECFDKVGGFNTGMPARQDYELWIRIARHFQFDYIQDPLVTLHVDSQNRLTEDVDSRIWAHKQILKLIQSDIYSLPWCKRRWTIGTQYYTMGRFLYENNEFEQAKPHLYKSFIEYPLNWKMIVFLVFSIFGKELRLDKYAKLKDRINEFI